MSESDTMGLAVQLQKHLESCATCQEAAATQKPVANLQGAGASKLCSEWFRIIDQWAWNEGRVNNIVAKDEYGHEAPKP